MVKKKTAETENNKWNDHTESIDNKENKDKVVGNTEDLPEDQKEKISGEHFENPEGQSKSGSDKDVAKERVFEEKLAEMQDKYLRLSAEFDNYRKRTLKEKMEISRYAGEELLKNILPIMDDFDRALKHMDTASDCKSVKEGIDLIYAKLSEFLKQQDIKEIESMNCDFNVDLHDAVAKITAPEEDKKGKIVDVVLKGYYLKDKVIRHSKVVIGE
jgi:molecular chaperone GrpE